MPAASSPPRSETVVAAAVLATVSSVLPGFLTGGLAVQISEEFDVSESIYGWALGSFFLAATFGSVTLGRIAQRVPVRIMISVLVLISATSQLVIAAFANSFALFIGCLAVCGFVNAGNQTAVNLLLGQAKLSRLGLAVAVKQSGMPGASMLAGLAVPAVALTVGWRWAYAIAAVFAMMAAVGVRRLPTTTVSQQTSRVVSTRHELVLAAVAGALLAFAAGALNSWTVTSGVDAGLSEGVAGLMLSVGAGSGIALRLAWGFHLDEMLHRPFAVAAATVAVGALGMLLLGFRSPPAHVIATLLAFGGGWIWPVFTNFGIVRRNPDAAGAATGVTQMGVYGGVFSAPLITGWLIETQGYGVMWTVVAALAIAGATVAWRVAEAF
ncbi:MAG: MFS transporter [Acidimicrobiales bacterium]|nr:MAG: MFS transporter [Acidimicrobiales bacterium]